MMGSVERILAALNEARVRYLIVGGVAVVLHGRIRTTLDINLVVQLERENVLRALGALARLGYRPRAPVAAESFADAATRRTWIEEKHLTVFSLSSSEIPLFEVDLFVSEPFDFDEVFARSLSVTLEREQVRVIGLDDLIALKQKVNRPRDQEDVMALLAIKDAQTKAGGSS
ncbi:MAG: DUF6036 family nucleotidyltransferase [Planctomycetota bacterium]